MHKKYKRKAYRPGKLAWFLLLFAWTMVLFMAGVMGAEALGIYETWAIFQLEPSPAPSPSPEALAEAGSSQDMRLADIQLSREQAQAMLDLRGDAPRILIYHTHTTEAYTQTADSPYKEAGGWRTRDNTKNVVAVGEALTACLRDVYGFSVIHDITDHEPPKLATAYERSEQTMQKIRETYPSIELCIDLHRDTFTITDKPTTDFVKVKGVELARMMLVVGQGEKYEIKPAFASNNALAARITENLKRVDEKLARPIRTKAGRYNQHITEHCILVEMGHNANTLEQALASVPYLAEAIAVALVEKQDNPSDDTPTGSPMPNWAP